MNPVLDSMRGFAESYLPQTARLYRATAETVDDLGGVATTDSALGVIKCRLAPITVKVAADAERVAPTATVVAYTSVDAGVRPSDVLVVDGVSFSVLEADRQSVSALYARLWLVERA